MPFASQARLAIPFYLGLRAPASRGRYRQCRVRAAAGRSPELIRNLLALYRGEPTSIHGTVASINFRCAAIALPDTGERFFLKQFPRQHALHDVERLLRCSRVDRAWRAAHLLPQLGVLTPLAVGTAAARAQDGRIVEYLATEWLDGALPFPERLRMAREDRRTRLALLCEFAKHLRGWHDLGIYLRDLVKNVLLRETPDGRCYWLTDLDGLHPYRSLTRSRVLRHMRQLARWAGPMTPEETAAICQEYLGEVTGTLADTILAALSAGETSRGDRIP